MSTEFRAMGTTVVVLAPDVDDEERQSVTQRAEALFRAAEARYSRFRPDSELSRLNRSEGPFVASAPLFDALSRAHQYHERTGGLFDPAVGAALQAHGYDRSFSQGALDRPSSPGASPPSRFSDVGLDAVTRAVLRPPGVLLDFGGFMKGHIADRAALQLPANGAIDAGGDLVVRGAGPEGRGWWVEVEDPRDAAATLVTLLVRDRAVATSAPNRRRWRAGGHWQHHLIDPRTQRPSRSDLAQVTVLADTAEAAEVLAKVVFLLGSEQGKALLSQLPEAAAVLVRSSGEVLVCGEVEVIHA